jgi:hypothetical protein
MSLLVTIKYCKFLLQYRMSNFFTKQMYVI